MRILFLTDYDPLNPSLRSGVPFYLYKALRHEYPACNYLHVMDQRGIFLRLFSRLVQFYFKNILLNKNGFYDSALSIATARSYGRQYKRINWKEVDVVFAISSRLLAYLPEGPAAVLWIDNSFMTFLSYPGMKGISQYSKREGLRVESLAFARANSIRAASGWLQAELKKQYPGFIRKILVMPRGANLSVWPSRSEVEEAIAARMEDSHLQLLFVNSGNWYVGRKGGLMVLETWRLLREVFQTKLTIIGSLPEEVKAALENEGVNCVGKLNLATDLGRNTYARMLSKAHFLFVPSLVDGFGIVYAEAAAYGLPSIARGIMGVTQAVQEGVTGYLLPSHAVAGDYAGLIGKVWLNRHLYNNLCRSAYQYASENYRWGKNAVAILEEMENIK